MSDLRVAIAQDWLAAEAGSERVTLELARLLPSADLYTTFFDPSIYEGELATRRVFTWPLQRVPAASRRFRSLLPLYPIWFSALDLRRYDLVISSSVAFTHAVRTGPGATHIAYVHTPLRYAWDLDTYLQGGSIGTAARHGARLIRPVLQRWDRWAGGRPDVLVANSDTVRQRIRRAWSRGSEVIYPPVDVDAMPLGTTDDGFLLVAARLIAYRRIDIAVTAATRLGRDLVVVGDGPETARLKALAGPTVRFTGRLPRPQLLDLFSRCHAYVVPGIEDFGIAPIEAMAAGKPVVGLRAGGVSETVVDGVTGVLFGGPSTEALVDALERLDTHTFEPTRLRTMARRYDTAVFRDRFRSLLERRGIIGAG